MEGVTGLPTTTTDQLVVVDIDGALLVRLISYLEIEKEILAQLLPSDPALDL